MLAVVLYHCHPRLEGTWCITPSLWGWAGVNLFFVLSGFLITSILLEARDKPHYFRNFYGRRALRIWPVYVLVLVVCYLNSHWFVGLPVLEAIQDRALVGLSSCLCRISFTGLPPAIGPTWSLAIEEQYYFFWAPIVGILRGDGCCACCWRRWCISIRLMRSSLRLDYASAFASASGRDCVGGVCWE